MKITDIRSNMRVRYMGDAPGLLGRAGKVDRIMGGLVEVYWDGRIVPSYIVPGSLRPVEHAARQAAVSEPETHQLNDGARFPSTLPNDSAERKQYPMAEVLFGQFPAAIAAVVHHSWKGNNKHNPGLPLQDNRSKSVDDENCILRHLAEGDYEGVAWRALRLLQRKLEAEGAPVAPLATNLPKENT